MRFWEVKCLRELKKNLKENYDQMVYFKRKDQLKTKEDVPVTEAFELYMLKNFFDIQLNSFSSKNIKFLGKGF